MNPQPMIAGERGLMTFMLALATFMVVLDTSIANVAIPSISGDLGVSPTQGTWVITSFAVSNAIAVPLTGWLARRFGEVKLFSAAILLFALASLGCGLSISMPMLIAFRVFQGAAAGPIIPLSQTLLLGIYPEDKKGMALAVWAMTALVAPISGPILGGWLTDNVSWPSIFYINVPIGLLCAYMVWLRMRARESLTLKLPIDAVGLALLAIGVGSLQIMLDKGGELDWFHSGTIVVLGIVATIALAVLVVWELTEKHPIVDLHLFARRNFTAATIATSLAYMVFFGSVVLLPLWLQTQMGYTPTWAGLAMAPTGVLAIFVTPLVGKNIHRLDPRGLATFGFVVFSACAFWRTGNTTGADFAYIALPQLVQGVGMACFFVPLIGIALSGLPPEQMASASGLFNFFRILAGGFGTSLATTLWERREALHHAHLAEQVTAFNPIATQALDQLQAQGMGASEAYGLIEQVITNQAYTLASNDVFWLAAWTFLALIPLVWLAKPAMARPGTVVAE